jgi:predicted nucleic acid-binding protein
LKVLTLCGRGKPARRRARGDAVMALAVRLTHPIYDCFYVALAEREQCALITADARLVAAAKGIKTSKCAL